MYFLFITIKMSIRVAAIVGFRIGALVEVILVEEAREKNKITKVHGDGKLDVELGDVAGGTRVQATLRVQEVEAPIVDVAPYSHLSQL